MINAKIIQGKGQYIQGAWVKGQGKTLESMNPANGQRLWQGHCATETDINIAYLAANQALSSWFALGFETRAQYTKKFAQLVEKNRDFLAHLISQETGKPLWESQTEVTAVIAKIALSIQAFEERTSAKIITADAHAGFRFKPHGVVVILGAFNFPAHLSNGHIVPALLAGNSILYKPSEQTPAVAEFIMQCWHESGLPKGVIQCLQGDAACGTSLLSKDIQGVYFTGSYLAGLCIHQQFSKRPEVILALEMGGNNPLIIDKKISNLKAAVYQTLLSTLITAGQRCTCARRVIIANSYEGDEFLEKFIKACKLIKIGSFDTQPEPFMGPVIAYNHAQKHLQAQKKLIEAGGLSLLPMKLLIEHTGFLSPGIVDMSTVNEPPDEEIFAPFIQIYRYDHFDQAIQLANQTRYGLCAGLFSDDEAHYQQFYHQVRAGIINWNRPTTGVTSNLPFGGVGLSGNHRPAGFFSADYCSYPVSSMEQDLLSLPQQGLPGINLESLHEGI